MGRNTTDSRNWMPWLLEQARAELEAVGPEGTESWESLAEALALVTEALALPGVTVKSYSAPTRPAVSDEAKARARAARAARAGR